MTTQSVEAAERVNGRSRAVVVRMRLRVVKRVAVPEFCEVSTLRRKGLAEIPAAKS